jgi:hypothetical protein
MKWYLVASILLLGGCSAEYHLKKAVKKNPSIIQKEVITVHDTTVLPSVVLRDTVRLKEIDTLTITKEKLRLNIVRIHDTLLIDAACEGDTIVKSFEVEVEKLVYVEKNKLAFKFYRFISLAVLLLVLVQILRRLIRVYYNRF